MRREFCLPFANRSCAIACFLVSLLSILALTSSRAEAKQQASTHLYFVTSHGCAPCRQVEPHIETLKREGYPVTTVQIGEHQQWAKKLGVDRTPTVVMISGEKLVGRHAGRIDAVTLKQWFESQGVKSGQAFTSAQANHEQPIGTKVVLGGGTERRSEIGWDSQTGNQATQIIGGQTRGRTGFSSPTMLVGTASPAGEAERLALQATVRLRVEDPEGISYATGTVIHSYRGESLVLTCGHVFRESQGKGEITVEYGFYQGQKKSAPGKLVDYDSDARDIALVWIRANENITPIKIAKRDSMIGSGLDIFSLGCDHGDDPTIRRSQIKNRAAYDGAIKYDIFGRPVNGRSGGGLFTRDGELIGVCNAAAVDEDEGIYTALDTIHWQLAQARLTHLFEPDARLAAASSKGGRPVRSQQVSAIDQNRLAEGRQFSDAQPAPLRRQLTGPTESRLAAIGTRASSDGRTQVTWNQGEQAAHPYQNASYLDDKEVIILVRSKSNPSQSQTITIDDPTPKLLDYLGAMEQSVQDQRHSRNLDVARLRTEKGVWGR